MSIPKSIPCCLKFCLYVEIKLFYGSSHNFAPFLRQNSGLFTLSAAN